MVFSRTRSSLDNNENCNNDDDSGNDNYNDSDNDARTSIVVMIIVIIVITDNVIRSLNLLADAKKQKRVAWAPFFFCAQAEPILRI